jgi:hypothetical protein
MDELLSRCVGLASRLHQQGKPFHLTKGNEVLLLNTAIGALGELMPVLTRDLEWAELFSGSGGATLEVSSLGLKTKTFDRINDAREDFCRLDGLIYAFALVMTLKEKSILWTSPQCSTWLFLALGHTKRKAPYWVGNDDRRDVLEANFTAMAMSPC